MTVSILSLKLLQSFITMSLLRDTVTSLIFWISHRFCCEECVDLWLSDATCKIVQRVAIRRDRRPDLLLPHWLDVTLIGHDPEDHHRGGELCWNHYQDPCLIIPETTVIFSPHFQFSFWCLYISYTGSERHSISDRTINTGTLLIAQIHGYLLGLKSIKTLIVGLQKI